MRRPLSRAARARIEGGGVPFDPEDNERTYATHTDAAELADIMGAYRCGDREAPIGWGEGMLAALLGDK